MTTPPSRAGGAATAAGMDFQADVGTWLSAHLAAEQSIGARFGLRNDESPTSLRFETGEQLDDIEVRTQSGARIYIQCKTNPSLSSRPDSLLGKTIGQLVAWYQPLRDQQQPIDFSRNVAVMAVKIDAPATLNRLEEACRFFDHGADWQDRTTLSEAKREALENFEACVTAAWGTHSIAMTDVDLASLARLFRIVRFDMGRGHHDWQDAADRIGRWLYGDGGNGEAAIVTLERTVHTLIRQRGIANQEGLKHALRAAGLEDTRSPHFDDNIARLRRHTERELTRLARHARLPDGGEGVPISRECIPLLRNAIDTGSLLLIGEPGAGKTGVLVTLANELVQDGVPTVFLSVDRLPDGDLEELGPVTRFLDVLAAWPGSVPGVLIIDSLDAARGGVAEAVFANLIEDAITRLGQRWSVVASIRTFDLKSGKRFRSIMAGLAPNPDYCDPDLNDVRHFRVERLSPSELTEVGTNFPDIALLLSAAPDRLFELLQNVFNLSLAADLICKGMPVAGIRSVSSQSDLIDRYNDERLNTHGMQVATTDAVERMVADQRLAVRAISVRHGDLEEVIRSGVLVRDGDLIAFAHHVLFDHAAGRFYLRWDNPAALVRQVTTNENLGFMLGPGLRYAIERVWTNGDHGPAEAWSLITKIASAPAVDPVISSVALRTAAERVSARADVTPLCVLIERQDVAEIEQAVSQLVSFVSVGVGEAGRFTSEAAIAWALVARKLIERRDRRLLGSGHFLLMTLFEKADFAVSAMAEIFGTAARGMLAYCWDNNVQWPTATANAVRCVAKSFNTDQTAAKALLRRALEEPHFTAHAHNEMPWLAEGILSIAACDIEFATEIYSKLFGRRAPSDAETYIGAPSGILSLRSNAAQDYEHARWRLSHAFPTFLAQNPSAGFRAASAAVIGTAFERYERDLDSATYEIQFATRTLQIVEDYGARQEWRTDTLGRNGNSDQILRAITEYMRTCSAEQFHDLVDAAITYKSASSIWARLFGIGIDRPGVADDLLWPVATTTEILGIRDVVRDAIAYVAAAYSTRSRQEREQFEQLIHDHIVATGPDADPDWWRHVQQRFLSIVPYDLLATSTLQEMKVTLQAERALTGNEPFISMQVGWAPVGDLTDDFLRSSGVNVDQGVDHDIRQVAKPLDELVLDRNSPVDVPRIASLWLCVSALTDSIESSVELSPREKTLQACWGSIGNAVDMIAGSDAFTPGENGHPTFDALLSVVDRLSASPYPTTPDSLDEDLMGWGNWDVRVYAASSLMALCRRAGERAPEIIRRLQPLLRDPIAAVRLQIAERLSSLWDISRDEMWRMIEDVAENDESRGVLGFLIAQPLMSISSVDPERCLALFECIMTRLAQPADDAEPSDKGRTLHEAGAVLVLRIWIYRGLEAAKGQVEAWTRNLVPSKGYLWHVISHLREPLFAGYAPDSSDDQRQWRMRARETLETIVAAAASVRQRANAAYREPGASDEQRRVATLHFHAAEELLDHAGNQLYFGSGAFQGSGTGLSSPEAMRDFFTEYGQILNVIEQDGPVRTLHHLVELYEYLAVAEPASVFDRIAALLTGPAHDAQYQAEGMASSALVRLVRRYLADHRNVFNDAARRGKLVTILKTFSEAGWPEALKLLYELPDFLR